MRHSINDAWTDVASKNLHVSREVLSADKVLTEADPQYQFLDPNGADRTITLPASPSLGAFVTIKNIGAADGLITPSRTIATGEVYSYIWDGTEWQELG